MFEHILVDISRIVLDDYRSVVLCELCLDCGGFSICSYLYAQSPKSVSTFKRCNFTGSLFAHYRNLCTDAYSCGFTSIIGYLVAIVCLNSQLDSFGFRFLILLCNLEANSLFLLLKSASKRNRKTDKNAALYSKKYLTLRQLPFYVTPYRGNLINTI